MCLLVPSFSFCINVFALSVCLPFVSIDRLGGLELKASALGAQDPGFESRLRGDFSRLSHTCDLKIGTPVATLSGA